MSEARTAVVCEAALVFLLVLCMSFHLVLTMKTRRIRCRSTYIIMAAQMKMRIKSFVEKPRPMLDTTKLVTIDTDIKNSCTEITMHMLKGLEKIADPTTYPRIARYMMMIATMTPIKCLCIGISPYENGILPTFAGAMSYSPTICIGCTPSVQVLSQIMSLIAVRIKHNFAMKSKNVDVNKIMSREEYKARFAMMIRCSYACLVAGVAFVNASPVITSNTAKRVRAASIFSEWIGGMIEIHSRNQYKLTIVSMGALAESSMNDVFKSYEGAKTNVRYTKTANPAMLQHMNVAREEDVTPISSEITRQEMMLDEIMGSSPGMTVRASFRWYTYSDELLETVVKENSILHLTKLLVDEAPEHLLDVFLETVVKSITNADMDAHPLANAFMDMGLGDNPSAGDNASVASGINPFATQIQQQQTESQQPTGEMATVNPFTAAINEYNTSSDRQASTGPNAHSESMQGPPMVTRRSTIGQMIDPSGKAVSHHVIVLDSIIKMLSENMNSFKDIQRDLGELLKRQANIYVKLMENRIKTPEEVSELDEYTESFQKYTETVMGAMEKAYATTAALPAVVEGDRGVYEHESQPVGPLMRRADGSTMKDFVYVNMKENAERSAQINSIMSPQETPQTAASGVSVMGASTPVVGPVQTSMNVPSARSSVATPTAGSNVGVSTFNPFEMITGSSVTVEPDLSVTGDTNMLQAAKKLVYGCADEMLDEFEDESGVKLDIIYSCEQNNWRDMTFKDVPAEIVALEYNIKTAKGPMNVLDCISLVMAEYMSLNSGQKPDKIVMENIFEVLNTDDDDRAGFLKMVPSWIKNTTSAMGLIEMMNSQSDDEEEESSDSDSSEESETE